MKVSVTVIIFVAMLLATAITAIIAFLPTHQAGITSVRDSIEVVRDNVVGRVVNGVDRFFKIPLSQVSTMLENWNAGSLDLSNDDTALRVTCGLMNDARNIVTGVFVYGPDSLLGCDQRLGFPMAGIVRGPNITMPTYRWDMAAQQYATPRQLVLEVDWNIPYLWSLLNNQTGGTNARRWTNAGPGFDDVTLGATVGLRDPMNPTVFSYRFMVYLHPPNLTPLLQGLGVGENGRVMLASGNDLVTFGTSWGEATSILFPPWADLTLPEDQRMKLKSPDDLTDPTVKKVMGELGGNAGFFSHTADYKLSMFSGADKLFVDIVRIVDDFQLDVRILIVLKERDFTQTIVDRQATTIGSVCGALVAMLLLSIGFAILLTRPLKRLGYRMQLTASLQDEGDDDPASLLSEVADMQKAYIAMKSELNRMKRYLPQAVLQGNDDDEEDEGDLNSNKQSGQVTPSHSTRLAASSSEVTSNRSSKATPSQRSTASSMHAGFAALNLARTVHRRRVAIACFNLTGFHSLSSQGSTTTMTGLQAKYLTIVSTHVRENKGFVDFFQGDHVLASFNGVTTVSSPGKRAVLASIAAAKELNGTPTMPSLTVGVALTPAAAGNMGNDQMMRFNVVGPVHAQAVAMERLARERLRDSMKFKDASLKPYASCCETALVAMTQDVVGDVELEIECQFFDLMNMGSQRRIVAFAGNPRQMAADEWMYQLENAERGDANQFANKVFSSLLEDDLDAVRSALTTIPTESPVLPRLKEIVDSKDPQNEAASLMYSL